MLNPLLHKVLSALGCTAVAVTGTVATQYPGNFKVLVTCLAVNTFLGVLGFTVVNAKAPASSKDGGQ
jgi:hypothetical protein